MDALASRWEAEARSPPEKGPTPRWGSRFAKRLLIDHLQRHRYAGRRGLTLDDLVGLFDTKAADKRRLLGDGGDHRPVLDRREGIRGAVEPDHDDLEPGGLYGLDRAQSHLVIGGEDGVDLGVRLENVLHDVQALSAVEVRWLTGDDFKPGRRGQRLPEPIAAIPRRISSRLSLKLDDIALAAELLNDQLAGQLAARHIVGRDMRGVGDALGRPIERQHGDFLSFGLMYPRPGRGRVHRI